MHVEESREFRNLLSFLQKALLVQFSLFFLSSLDKVLIKDKKSYKRLRELEKKLRRQGARKKGKKRSNSVTAKPRKQILPKLHLNFDKLEFNYREYLSRC